MKELEREVMDMVSGGWDIGITIGPVSISGTPEEWSAWFGSYAAWWGDYYSTYGMSNY